MDFLDQVQSDTLKGLYNYWDGKRGGRAAPSRDDIDPTEMGPFLPYLMLLDLTKTPGRFWFRLIGTHFADQFGEDVTGRYADEVDFGEARDEIIASYAKSAETIAPTQIFGEYTKADGRMMRFERISLPLSTDGVDVDMVLCGIISLYLNR